MAIFRMTSDEKDIWKATYASAYVRLFHDELQLRHQTGKGGYDDVGSQVEMAMDIADKAVAELRKWIKEEGKDFYEGTKEMKMTKVT